MSEGSSIKKHFRDLYRFIPLCLQLADLADAQGETPFNDVLPNGLHMGYRTFSGFMRGGVKEIIDLQNDFYGMAFKAEYAERDEKAARDFLQECFGDREIDSINEDDRNRILFLCNKIRQEWESNGAE